MKNITKYRANTWVLSNNNTIFILCEHTGIVEQQHLNLFWANTQELSNNNTLLWTNSQGSNAWYLFVFKQQTNEQTGRTGRQAEQAIENNNQLWHFENLFQIAMLDIQKLTLGPLKSVNYHPFQFVQQNDNQSYIQTNKQSR